MATQELLLAYHKAHAIKHGMYDYWCKGDGMSVVRKTITLTSQQHDWVKSRIVSGDFTNDSEYFRDLIRRDQERSMAMLQLRAALEEGEQSGISERRPQDILDAARERLRLDGKLPT